MTTKSLLMLHGVYPVLRSKVRGVSQQACLSKTTLVGINIMKKTDLAYCAGLIDGEGSIGVYKYKTSVSRAYAGHLAVSMTRRESLDKIAEVAGGVVYTQKFKTKANKAIYTWKLNIRKAVVFLKRILPYLIVKRKNAENLIAYDTCLRVDYQRRGGGRRKLSLDEETARDTFCEISKELNK
jgi:hypothetical protein